MNYFAVEVLGETQSQVAGVVVTTAANSGYRFTRIESMDRTKVGSVEFQRFRVPSDPSRLLSALFLSGRSVVTPEGEVKMRGKKGTVPLTFLLSAPRNPQVYRGPGDPHWQRQFE